MYPGLRALVREKGVRILFEATVTLSPALACSCTQPRSTLGGGCWVWARGADPALCASLFREALPAARLERFRGILNSTTKRTF